MVFKIGNTSYADHVIAGTYQINQKDIGKEWTDANQIKHKTLMRTKVSGSCDMFFRTIEEFNEFVANIKAVKTTNQSVPMELTVNNVNEDKEIDAFIDFDAVRNRDGMWKDYILRYTLSVEER
jgi:hypothetical protein